MMVLRCSSAAKSMQELVGLSSSIGDLLLISPSAARTEKELEACFRLARESFASGGNLSPKLANEALLFLSREVNFSSATRKVGAASPDDFVLVCPGRVPIARLKAKLKLTCAQSLALSEWGEKKGGYSEAELAIEAMALSRIRN